MYPVGFPGWKIAARFGAPILIPVRVLHDKEAGVYVITSEKLRGLIVEMPDSAPAEDIHRELDSCVYMLMEELLSQPPRSRPVTAWPGEFQPA
jgi:hypothetical protein